MRNKVWCENTVLTFSEVLSFGLKHSTSTQREQAAVNQANPDDRMACRRWELEFSLSEDLKATLWMFLTLNQTLLCRGTSKLQLVHPGVPSSHCGPLLSTLKMHMTDISRIQNKLADGWHVLTPGLRKHSVLGQTYCLRRSNTLDWFHLFQHGSP